MIPSNTFQKTPLFDISFSRDEFSDSLLKLLRKVNATVRIAEKTMRYYTEGGFRTTGRLVVLNESDLSRSVNLVYRTTNTLNDRIATRTMELNNTCPREYVGYEKADFRSNLWESVCASKLTSFSRRCWGGVAPPGTKAGLAAMVPSFYELRTICGFGLEYGVPNALVVYLSNTQSSVAIKKFPHILLGYTNAQSAIASTNTFLERL